MLLITFLTSYNALKFSKVPSPFGPEHFFSVVTLVLIVWHNFILSCTSRTTMTNTRTNITAIKPQIKTSLHIFFAVTATGVGLF